MRADPDAAAPSSERSSETPETATLSVVPPTHPRESVESTGRVGAVAYPYRVYEASATVGRSFLPERELSYVASVDRSRRLVLRADTLPETETRTVEDVLVLPADLSEDECDERVRSTVFEWTMRKFALGSPPEVSFGRVVDAYKLFWIAERPDGDVIVDSVRGEESPLDG